MELVKFMNEHVDWRIRLAREPYNLEIKEDGEYVLLKYDQYRSNMASPLVQEARGSIFRQNESHQWVCVARAFDKFFNFGESNAATPYMDWEHIFVNEKVDGSLIKVWYDRGEWHVSTNGTLDAKKCMCDHISFYDLLMKAPPPFRFWETYLDPDYCYMFELTSPRNRIVVQYKSTELWYLGRRNMHTMVEDREDPRIPGVRIPATFEFHSLSECIEAARELDRDHEGFVVADAAMRRVKIKGDEYLRLHHIKGNGVVTIRRVVDMWQQDSLDDFLAYFPEYKNFAHSITTPINEWIATAETEWNRLMQDGTVSDRASFARQAFRNPPLVRSCLFALLDNKTLSPAVFFKDMRQHSLAAHIRSLTYVTAIGREEDA